MATQHDNILDAQEHVELEDFLQSLEWQSTDIDANWLDPKEEYRRPEYTLSYLGVPFAPLGGIHGLTGQPGHGKTFTFTQLMLAILKQDYQGIKYELATKIPEPKVLYIDTEMEKGNTQLVMLRVYDQMGWTVGSEHDNFRILWLREVVKSEDRWRMVLKAIWTMRPTVVFLDGLIDVIGDFNDNKECQQIIYQCMATASHYHVSLWCLLHENPGSEKMVGHAGSFLERKATDILKTKKDKSSGTPFFTVSQNKARSRDLPDWHFRIEDDDHHYGHPVITEAAEVEKEEKLTAYEKLQNEVKATVLKLSWDITGKSYTEFENGLKSLGITSSRKISDYFVISQQIGLVYKDGKRYKIKYENIEDIDSQSSFEDNSGKPF